jgi:hypothetical protein
LGVITKCRENLERGPLVRFIRGSISRIKRW